MLRIEYPQHLGVFFIYNRWQETLYIYALNFNHD